MPEPTITVTVQSSKGPATFTEPQHVKVGELAQKAADHFGFAYGPNIALFLGKDELDANRPLVSLHLPENPVLVLTDTSGGV